MNENCNWCQRPAVTRFIRTVGKGKDRTTKTYCECRECRRTPTNKLVGKYTMLCTVPDDDTYYSKWFVVETEWLKGWIQEEHDGELSEKELREALEEFLENYTWDETWWTYQNAKSWNAILSEGHDQ